MFWKGDQQTLGGARAGELSRASSARYLPAQGDAKARPSHGSRLPPETAGPHLMQRAVVPEDPRARAEAPRVRVSLHGLYTPAGKPGLARLPPLSSEKGRLGRRGQWEGCRGWDCPHGCGQVALRHPGAVPAGEGAEGATPAQSSCPPQAQRGCPHSKRGAPWVMEVRVHPEAGKFSSVVIKSCRTAGMCGTTRPRRPGPPGSVRLRRGARPGLRVPPVHLAELSRTWAFARAVPAPSSSSALVLSFKVTFAAWPCRPTLEQLLHFARTAQTQLAASGLFRSVLLFISCPSP